MSLLSVDLGPLAEKASRIRIRGGVVGRLSYVLIASVASLAVIAWSAGNVYVAGGTAVLATGLVSVLGWRMLSFAEKHPQAALMEGAEFLLHERMTLGMKGRPSEIAFDPSQAMTNPHSPSPALTQEAEKTDSLTIESKEATDG